MKHLFFIARWRGFKVSPSCFVAFEGAEFIYRQLGSLSLLERIHAGFACFAVRKGRCTSGRHAPLLLQVVAFVDVYRAPNRRCFARREADGVGRIVNALAYAVYPAMAQRFVNGFWSGHARVTGANFVKPHQQLAGHAGVGCKPSTKILPGFEIS